MNRQQNSLGGWATGLVAVMSVVFAVVWVASDAQAAPAAPASGQQQVASALLARAEASLRARNLGLARLQVQAAEQWHAGLVRRSATAGRVADAVKREQTLVAQGDAAAQARDLVQVQRIVGQLLALDSHSAAALRLVLRYQAAMLDQGGAFARITWPQWMSATTLQPSPHPRQASPTRAAEGKPAKAG